eukprot:scaffold1213_cov256-Pinguiococcus_pyrenoidosus.AAC.2
MEQVRHAEATRLWDESPSGRLKATCGPGMSTATAQFWDKKKDGIASIAFNNGNMHCVVTVFGLCVHTDDPQEEM